MVCYSDLHDTQIILKQFIDCKYATSWYANHFMRSTSLRLFYKLIRLQKHIVQQRS